MKKRLVVLFVLLVMVFSACSNEEGSSNEEEQKLDESIEGNNNGEEKEEEIDNDTSEEDEDSEGVSGGFETQTEDQLDLTIGDTGRFDTDLTTFEITLEDAEIIEGELDGVEPQFDSLILLDITLKNTGEMVYPVQDLMYGFEATDYLEGTGVQNAAEFFDSVKEMTGELAPGEEVSGQFITDIHEAEEYYFRLRSGITGSGASNEVIWTIPAEEAKK
ncbi:hypothetical protein BN988_00255 [Oceanobacillus picturae]|uniref:DUF4352 domain-containing protein n=1 Tax=Oceanobacillus picturae TaxID=171693 RepID=W9A7P8_9BACI|nr:hypothetical protein [Oceanobacillus picturae]RIU93609.1 hypothetical protein D1864_06440 [Oceanobacillus picturae]CDO01809.1 hypothetical protein BN988_00255 [Oceanobacillus picturae]